MYFYSGDLFTKKQNEFVNGIAILLYIPYFLTLFACCHSFIYISSFKIQYVQQIGRTLFRWMR
jgi:hypothetical protein